MDLHCQKSRITSLIVSCWNSRYLGRSFGGEQKSLLVYDLFMLLHDFFISCSLFMTCLCLTFSLFFHGLFTVCSWHCPWLVHNLFILFSLLVHDFFATWSLYLFMICSWLVFKLIAIFKDLFLTCTWFGLNLFITFHALFMTC